MSKPRRVDFMPDAYLVGVAGLTLELQGMYWLVCSLNGSTGKPISLFDDRLKRLGGIRVDKMMALVDKLVTLEKLERKGDLIWSEVMIKSYRSAKDRIDVWEKNLGENKENNDLASPRGPTTLPLPPIPINKEPKPVSNTARENGFLNGDEGGNAPRGAGWRFEPHDDTLAEARQIARGWDIQGLLVKYRAYQKDRPYNPDRAFIGWLKSYTKNRKP